MKLYESQPAPNSRRVHMFMDEKDIELSRVNVDIRAGDRFSIADITLVVALDLRVT
ncbi:MAG: hypothetical protein ACR2PZ_07135 [Pseudomonadales bacterium]